jgi:hypothetical protein
MSGTPIELKLYDADDNVSKTLIRSVVPWGLMKKALRLGNTFNKINPEDMSESDLDELTAFIVAIFGDKVTMEEIEAGADTGDMMAVMNQIVAKAQGLMPSPNPISPGKKTRARH